MGDNKYFKNLGFRVTSDYGPRVLNGEPEFHPGVDLVTKKDGPLYAFTEGEVIWSGEGIKGSGYGGYGIVVAIKDANSCVHVYGHLSKVAVHKGAKVKKGDLVGYQGNTGKSFGQHLHYEVRKTVTYVQDREKRCHIPDDYLIKYFKTTDAEIVEPKAKVVQKPVSSGRIYTVQAGNTLSGIADAYDTTVAAIMKLNPEIKDASKISVGQKIKLG